MERSVSLSLGCDVVVVRAHHARPTDVPKYPRTGEEDRAGLIRTRARAEARGTLLLLFLRRSFAAALYSRPDNLRPLIYATKRSRTRRVLSFFFFPRETCLVRSRTRSEYETCARFFFFLARFFEDLH